MDVKDKVYEFISEQLTLGKLEKNDRITEQFLVDNIGLSRTPIREALLQLASDGILEREPRKGFKLKTFKKKDLEDLYVLIGTLDGKIIEMVMNQMTEEDFSMMNFLIDSMDSAIENSLYTKYNELQVQFHDIYIDKCHNQVLKQEIKNKKKIFIGKAYSNVDSSIIKEVLLKTNQEHRQMLELMRHKETIKLRYFLEDVHWKKENVEYDIW